MTLPAVNEPDCRELVARGRDVWLRSCEREVRSPAPVAGLRLVVR